MVEEAESDMWDRDGGREGGIKGYRGWKCGYFTYNINTLGTEPNAPLEYTPGKEIYCPIMSTLGGHISRLEREIERNSS